MSLHIQLPRSHASLALIVAMAFLLFLNLESSRSLVDDISGKVEDDERRADFVGGARRKVVEITQTTPPRIFTKVPEGHEKTFYYDGKAISRPAVRALRSRGWQLVNHPEDAQLIYFYSAKPPVNKLQPWQRFSHLPTTKYWNEKDWFVDEFNKYQDKTGIVPYFLPESYQLEEKKDRKAFKERITQQGGMNSPWVLKEPNVNQGKGIEIIPPNSERLLEVANLKQNDDNQYIIQQYICNELTWGERKFDVRMFWFVASVDPLIVLYQDGYARIGNGVYTEDDFSNTVSHLTTHTRLGEEGKADYDAFVELVKQHHKSSPDLGHIRDPVMHVKNQFKDSLSEFIVAFKDSSFSPTKKELIGAENVFGFYGADFIVDKDLDVWLIEPQRGCGLDEDFDFRITMHARLFRGIVDTMEEIWKKQEEGKPVLPLINTGEWEVIYGDGWRYNNKGYERSKAKKGCSAPKQRAQKKQG